MEEWVLYKKAGQLLVGFLLSSRGRKFVYVERVFSERVSRTMVYGFFSSEKFAMNARDTINDDPFGYGLRTDVAKLPGYLDKEVRS